MFEGEIRKAHPDDVDAFVAIAHEHGINYDALQNNPAYRENRASLKALDTPYLDCLSPQERADAIRGAQRNFYRGSEINFFNDFVRMNLTFEGIRKPMRSYSTKR